MNNKNTDDLTIKPWYKHFWPWFIIAIPASSVVAGIAMIIMANNGADSLVKDNYYKEGLAINQQIKKLNKAKELGIKAVSTIEQGKLTLQIEAIDKLQGQLFLDFRHATQSEKDFQIAMQRSASGSYFSFIQKFSHLQNPNKWYVTLRPLDNQWELETNWVYPHQTSIKFGD